MRVGIKFNDNDFYNTFMPFMKCLKEIIKWREDDSRSPQVTKQDIVDLCNACSYPIYMMCQNMGQYSDGVSTKSYLVIDASRVYFNEEIDEKLKTYKQWGNHDFFYLDTDYDQMDCW